MENLPRRGFTPDTTCCACSSVSFTREIIRDSTMVNIVSQKTQQPFMNNTRKCALVIGGKVYVAWKRKMLHDVIVGHQAYIQRKKDLFAKPRISQLAKTARG